MESEELGNGSKPVPRRFPVKSLVLAGLAIVLLFPYQTTVVPEWKIRVVDDNGEPFAGARVRQQWYHGGSK